jgi:NADH:ubiquinone oxidoreductase subunit 4 (subunit M)
MRDLVPREGLTIAVMVIVVLWLGLYPRPVLSTFAPVVEQLSTRVARR